MKPCEKCNTDHDKPGRFCSRSCANSKVFSSESNEKRKDSMKKFYSSLSAKERSERVKHNLNPEKRKATIAKIKSQIPWNDKSPGLKRKTLFLEQNNTCLICNLSVWLDQPIALELDHIDGNHQNNEKSNLRLICPNCHAQTPSWRRAKAHPNWQV